MSLLSGRKTDDLSLVDNCLEKVARRLGWRAIHRYWVNLLLALLPVYLVLLVLDYLEKLVIPAQATFPVFLLVSLGLGLLLGRRRRPDPLQAARRLEKDLNLPQSISTAVEYRDRENSLSSLLANQANDCAFRANPDLLYPYIWPKNIRYLAVGLVLCALLSWPGGIGTIVSYTSRLFPAQQAWTQEELLSQALETFNRHLEAGFSPETALQQALDELTRKVEGQSERQRQSSQDLVDQLARRLVDEIETQRSEQPGSAVERAYRDIESIPELSEDEAQALREAIEKRRQREGQGTGRPGQSSTAKPGEESEGTQSSPDRRQAPLRADVYEQGEAGVGRLEPTDEVPDDAEPFEGDLFAEELPEEGEPGDQNGSRIFAPSEGEGEEGEKAPDLITGLPGKKSEEGASGTSGIGREEGSDEQGQLPQRQAAPDPFVIEGMFSEGELRLQPIVGPGTDESSSGMPGPEQIIPPAEPQQVIRREAVPAHYREIVKRYFLQEP